MAGRATNDRFIKKRATIPLISASEAKTISIGTKFGRILAIRSRNCADATLAAAGTDAATKIKLTDANGAVVFLDAADRDYKTAEVTLWPAIDDTLTGINVIPVDATGAAFAAGQQGMGLPVQGPVTVTVINGGTVTDVQYVDLIVER